MTRSRIGFFVALTIVLLLGVFLSSVIYGNSPGGFGYLLGEFAGAAALPSLLGLLTWRRSPYATGTFVLIVAAIAVGVSNMREVLDSFAVNESRAALKEVSDPTQLEKALKENPSNVHLKLFSAAYKASTETGQLLQELLEKLEPPTLARALDYSRASRVELEQYRRDLRIAEANAAEATQRFVAFLKDEREKVEAFAKTLRIDDRTVRGVLSGIEERHAANTAFNSQMSSAVQQLYRALGKALDIVIEQFGSYKVQANGQFVFSSQLIADRYTAAANEINAAARRVAELENERKQLVQADQERFKRFVSGK